MVTATRRLVFCDFVCYTSLSSYIFYPRSSLEVGPAALALALAFRTPFAFEALEAPKQQKKYPLSPIALKQKKRATPTSTHGPSNFCAHVRPHVSCAYFRRAAVCRPPTLSFGAFSFNLHWLSLSSVICSSLLSPVSSRTTVPFCGTRH